LPRNRFRMSTMPLLSTSHGLVPPSTNINWQLLRQEWADRGEDETHLHCPRPLESCWHFVGSSSSSGGRRQSVGLLRCTMMQSDSWRHWARA
jgi:hypothetical protein